MFLNGDVLAARAPVGLQCSYLISSHVKEEKLAQAKASLVPRLMLLIRAEGALRCLHPGSAPPTASSQLNFNGDFVDGIIRIW
jgi:hypothetical protein